MNKNYSDSVTEYQPRGARGTACNGVTPTKSKMTARKGVYPYVFGHSHQFSLNNFFDLSTPPMKKVDNGGEKKGRQLVTKL